MAIKECFGCEKLYEYNGSCYCSEECGIDFNAALSEEIEEAKALGLVTNEGVALTQGNSLSEVQAKSIIDQFKLKVKIP